MTDKRTYVAMVPMVIDGKPKQVGARFKAGPDDQRIRRWLLSGAALPVPPKRPTDDGGSE